MYEFRYIGIPAVKQIVSSIVKAPLETKIQCI